MLIQNHQINAQQLAQLDVLSTDCKIADGNIVAIYRHLLIDYRPASCNILHYHEEQLIGFLSTFFFYEDRCEMTVMVAPAFRRQGIAKRMLYEILPLIHARNIKTLVFSTPHDLNNLWLMALGFSYQHSEYQMHRQQNEPVAIQDDSLTVRLATHADIPALCFIDSACFSKQQLDMTSRFDNLLNEPNYKLLILHREGVPIGKAHLHLQQDNTRLTDLAILPPVQGLGFGSTLIAHCINYSLATKQPNVILDVETINQQALKLYIHLGFVINNACDFWTIPSKSWSAE